MLQGCAWIRYVAERARAIGPLRRGRGAVGLGWVGRERVRWSGVCGGVCIACSVCCVLGLDCLCLCVVGLRRSIGGGG